jgi:replicative DNA helicase
MSKAHYQTAADVFDGWRDDVLTGEPPTLYPVGTGELARIEVGPKLVTLIGGAPGAGKTAFTMQCVVDALRLTDTLRALVCNIEMSPTVLLDRQLARLSGIDAAIIRYRKLAGSHADRLDQAMNTLEHVAERLCFVRPPFNLANVAAAADAFSAGVLLLDYIQRIPPPGEHGDRRGSVDATMNYLRQFADAGVGVIVVAAVARQKDNRGRSSYAGDSLSLASFRESSELEFGADDAFILSPDSKMADVVLLRHLKARHTEPRDITLHFDRQRQRFTPAAPIAKTMPDGKLQSALAALWDKIEPAADTELGGDRE